MTKSKSIPIRMLVKAIPLCIWYWPQWMWRDFKAAFRAGYKARNK